MTMKHRSDLSSLESVLVRRTHSAWILLRELLPAQAGVAAVAVLLGTSMGWADEATTESPVSAQSAPNHEPPAASPRATVTTTNFQVKKLDGEDSSKYELSVDLTIRWSFDAESLERRRAVLEEKARLKRLLELLAEDIRRTRAGAQQRGLTLEVEDPLPAATTSPH